VPGLLCLSLPLALLAFAPPAPAEEVLVFAAASLTDALEEIAGHWEQASGHETRGSTSSTSIESPGPDAETISSRP
jgi:ABC-type molybdate transport system substrate-binding protein